MALIQFFISQVLSFGIVPWCVFITITMLTARYVGWPGVVIGHILNAVIVNKLNYDWVQSEMSKPDRDGLPDMDITFFICTFIYTVMINTTLLPISILCFRWRSRHSQRRLAAAAH